MYLANICNSTVIEICKDIFRVSQRFRDCQMLEYIADSNASPLKTGDDDITSPGILIGNRNEFF